ncbi:hypothetical protein [Capnocytophaga canimorsus]|uniref:hypothetical protein n=1 Tax=Capnocytophaga canimorsus TaxID=28188 RepID=UPI0037CEEB67
MKNFKLILLLGIIFLFQSCQKENNNNVQYDNKVFENPFEQVGVQHNEMLENVLFNLKVSSKKEQIEFVNSYLENELKKIKLNTLDVVPENYNKYVENHSVYYNGKDLYRAFLSLDKMSQKSTSNSTYIYARKNIQDEVNDVLDFLDSNELTLAGILEEVKKREIIAVGKFKQDELESIYSFYSTLRHSAKYGAPEKEGGKGGFDKYIAKQHQASYSKTAREADINWWKVGGCDAIGALVGSRGGFWGAVITGAGASAISVIMQL